MAFFVFSYIVLHVLLNFKVGHLCSLYNPFWPSKGPHIVQASVRRVRLSSRGLNAGKRRDLCLSTISRQRFDATAGILCTISLMIGGNCSYTVKYKTLPNHSFTYL